MKEVVGTLYTMAPEVLNGGITYDKSCDMWSIGVMAFVLLSGDMPFNVATKQKLVRAVEEGSYEFSGRRWNIVSAEARRAACLLVVVVSACASGGGDVVLWSCFSPAPEPVEVAPSNFRSSMLRPF